MSQKIAIISFDHWDYDHHIVGELQAQGVESFHIKIGNFKYKSFSERIINTLSKVFLGKNPKIKKRQDYIIEMLKIKGFQDQILVINPELISKEYHLEIKKFTNKYTAYLYDSVARCPVEHLLNNVFDDVYSFDLEDVKMYNLKHITNYIYFKPSHLNPSIKQDYIYIGSIDNRLEILNNYAQFLKTHGKSFKFYAIGKKAFVNKIKQVVLRKNRNLIFKSKRFNQSETLNIYNESAVILDLVRENQVGLSFRVFEAIGLQKNIITNNNSILKYDLFVPNKMKIFQPNSIFEFSNENYSDEISTKYSLLNWTKTVFDL